MPTACGTVLASLVIVLSANYQLCSAGLLLDDLQLLSLISPDVAGDEAPTTHNLARSALVLAMEAQFDGRHSFEIELDKETHVSKSSVAQNCTPTVLHATKDGKDFKPGVNNPKLGYGVALELLSCAFSNMGLLMEKRALVEEEKRLGNVVDVKSYKIPLWWAGFLVFVVGQVISGFALAFVTVVVIAPLGSFSLVFNLFTSYYYAKEPTSVLQIVSSLIIVTGCVLTTAFAPWRKADNSMDCFRYYLGHADFHLLSAVLIGTVALVILISRTYVLPAQKQTSDQAQWLPSARLSRWLYPVASGLTAVWSINVGAVLMRFMGEAFSGERILDTWEFWVVLAIYVCLIVGWQTQMNACMIVLKAAYVIPINFAFLTMTTLPLSGVLHGTLDDWHPDSVALVLYLGGLSMNIIGMAGLLASSDEDSPAKGVNEESDTAPLN